ncbi:MAG: hypothetical protein EBV03_02365 [Proteobacteria bacterium]|nr:hypothetical protein [Pseudomonadota bacterium]
MATRKRKKTRQQSQNAIMNWIVLFLVAAAAIQNFNSRVENPESAPGKEDKSAINLPSLEQLKQARAKILPGPDDEVLTLQDVQPGSGAPASCGQQVSVAYTTFDEGNVPLDDTASKESPLHFTIGQKKVLPALDEGVMGMKPGGLRNIFAPPALAYGAEGFAKSGMPAEGRVRFTVELLEASPKLPSPGATAFRFFDTRKGAGNTLGCGDTGKFTLTVWATGGEKLFPKDEEKSASVSVTPGSGLQFLGLEQAAIGMRPGGARSIIVPPDFQKILNEGAATLPISFPKGQTVLVDIEAAQE